MKALRVWMLAVAILAAGTAFLAPATAQVSGADVQMSSSAILNAGNRAARVKAIKKVPSVGVVRLDFGPPISAWSDQPDPAEYRIMVSNNQAGVNKLRQALQSNPVTRAALAKRGIDPSQVAGAVISSTGALRLYIFSR